MSTAMFRSSGNVSDLPTCGPPQALAVARARQSPVNFLYMAIPCDVFRPTGNQAESAGMRDHTPRLPGTRMPRERSLRHRRINADVALRTLFIGQQSEMPAVRRATRLE